MATAGLSVLFIALSFGLTYFLTLNLLPQVRLAFLTAVPVLSLLFYLVVGAPGLAGRAQADLLAENKFHPEALTAAIENKLADNPKDYQGWHILGQTHLRLRHFYQAEESFRRADSLRPEQISTLVGLAQAKFFSSQGLMKNETIALVRRILLLDRQNIPALFLLAQAQEQNGQKALAKKTLALLKRLIKRLDKNKK